jgi:hypothetical protein
MVDYSQDQANPSEIATGYSDEGYVPTEFKEPAESYEDMNKAGVTVESTGRLSTNIKKQQAPNPKLLREKRLKILFLQYINKYLSNPNKYIRHPKQIRQLPSWFDEAMSLFKDNEISRYQKKMIREFFYGLIQYRDSKMVSERYGVNTEEVNRQLGESSPYSETGGLGPELQLPREQELKRDMDMRDLMRRTREIDINKPSEEVPYEEYGGINPFSPPIPITSTTKGKATFGQLGLGRVNQSNSTVDDYVKFNKSEQVMPGETQSNPVQKPVQTNVNPTANVLRSNKGVGLRNGSGSTAGTGAFNVGRGMLGGIFGNMNRNQMLGAVGLPGPKVQNTPTVVSQATVERRRRKAKIKMNRKLKKKDPLTIDNKSSDTISKVLRNVNNMSTGKLKPLKQTTINPSRMKPMNSSTKKNISGLSTVRNMDQLFTQIKSVSSKEFGKENMKMKVVSNIKEQCDKAFAKNKFKQESMKMKKNYFNDVKAAYPQMKMDIEEMGDIKENYMMQRSMHDVPKIINSRRTTSSLMVKRGDMRPQSMGIVDYDFSIEPLGKKKSKKLELFDEDDFIERSG